MAKGLEKFAKLKNQEELTAEINRIKDEVRVRQVELACLENMMFASENDNASSSISKKSGDHRYSYDSGNAMNRPQQYDVELGGDPVITDIDRSLPPTTPHTITGKIHFSATRIPEIDLNGNVNDHSENNYSQENHQNENEEV
eukprot:CAMPEP_0174825650 /NCGR_PEP_ID=MMETSP1107-20130205/42964_1 /TAXON_ID=36770 /ORGANISM="Paraphysomonas vestita, Strain GFlagA" /LENGTH=142 /DNA_ID=CAMNT_0016057461 /DNA_START=3613 /DNA_END=4041 /DNA_ORIENTATION=-